MIQTRAKIDRDSQGRAVANRSADHRHGGNTAVMFDDNSTETLQLEKLQLMAGNSPQAAHAARLQAIADGGPDSAVQVRQLAVDTAEAPTKEQETSPEGPAVEAPGPSPEEEAGEATPEVTPEETNAEAASANGAGEGTAEAPAAAGGAAPPTRRLNSVGVSANTARIVSLNWRMLEKPAAKAISAKRSSVVSTSVRAV